MDLVSEARENKYTHKFFVVGVILKALNAVLEIVGGTLLLFTGSATKLVDQLTQAELIEDPTDIAANLIQHYVPYIDVHTQVFAAVYLLSHGIIKILLATSLLRGKLWAYPSAIAVFALFIVYQLYRYMHTHSFFLLLLTLFDVAVIVLTWREYKNVQTKLRVEHE